MGDIGSVDEVNVLSLFATGSFVRFEINGFSWIESARALVLPRHLDRFLREMYHKRTYL